MPQQPADTIILVVTHRCNMDCDYCPVEKRGVSMSADTARAAIENVIARAPGKTSVRFFGGEPLLEYDLCKSVIEQLATLRATKEIACDLTTNGSLLDAEKISYFRERPEIELILSIDGGETTHNKHRARAGSNAYHWVRRHSEQLAALPNVTVNKVVTPATAETLAEDFMLIVKMGFNRVNILPAYYMEWDAPALRRLERNLDAVLRALDVFNMNRRPVTIKNKTLTGDRPLFNTATVIDADGSIYLSNIFMHRLLYPHRRNLKIGHISDPAGVSPLPFPENEFIERHIPATLIKSTLAADAVLGKFVRQL